MDWFNVRVVVLFNGFSVGADYLCCCAYTTPRTSSLMAKATRSTWCGLRCRRHVDGFAPFLACVVQRCNELAGRSGARDCRPLPLSLQAQLRPARAPMEH